MKWLVVVVVVVFVDDDAIVVIIIIVVIVPLGVFWGSDIKKGIFMNFFVILCLMNIVYSFLLWYMF